MLSLSRSNRYPVPVREVDPPKLRGWLSGDGQWRAEGEQLVGLVVFVAIAVYDYDYVHWVLSWVVLPDIQPTPIAYSPFVAFLWRNCGGAMFVCMAAMRFLHTGHVSFSLCSRFVPLRVAWDAIWLGLFPKAADRRKFTSLDRISN